MMNAAALQPHRIFFETLANDARWRIVHLLQKEPHSVTDISKKLELEQSLISHHLRRLYHCGFVYAQRSGKERIYSLNQKTIKPLLKLMDNHINTYCKKVALSKQQKTTL